MSERILVTGAAGFIGFHLCRALCEKGFEVTGFDSLNDYYDPRLKAARLDVLGRFPNFTFTCGNLADERAVDALFAACEPDYVVNLAAQAGVRYSIDHPRAYLQSNVLGFFNVLEAVRAHPVRHLVYASSSSVYGDTTPAPFCESANVDKPVSLYAATKKSDELLAYAYSHLYGVPATGLRFFTVYGPFGRPDMAYFSFTKKIMAGEPIDVYNGGDLMRDFTYIDDVVDGVLALLGQPPKPDETGAPHTIYNLGNNRPVRLLDFIETLERALGKTAKKRFLPMQPGDVHETYANIDKSAAAFGFAPKTSLEQGLARFADWYRSYYA